MFVQRSVKDKKKKSVICDLACRCAVHVPLGIELFNFVFILNRQVLLKLYKMPPEFCPTLHILMESDISRESKVFLHDE